MTGEVMIPYAMHNSGRIVHISDVEGGLSCECTCIECGKDLLARKGDINTHHFAHSHSSDAVCSGESILHKAAKIILSDRIRNSAGHDKINCSWRCTTCRQVHTGDLMKGVYSVMMEKRVGSSVGDIVLYNDIDEPVKVVEIVVTHAPTPETVQNYEDMGVHMLEYVIDSFEQLSDLLTDDIRFAPNGMCRSPKCKKCGAIPVSRNMFYRWLGCDKCKLFTKIPFIQIGSIFQDTQSPAPYNTNILFADQFNNKEIITATKLRDSGMRYLHDINCEKRGIFKYDSYSYACKTESCNLTFSLNALYTITKDVRDSSRIKKWVHVSSSMACPSCDKTKSQSKAEVFSGWYRNTYKNAARATP